MDAPAVALGLYVAYLTLTFGLRTWLHHRRTGTTGYHGLSGPPGSAGWWGGILFLVALAAGVAAPILQLAELVEPVATLDRPTVQITGLAVAIVGIMCTLAAQRAMGRSWRVGVDPTEANELVREGLFAVVRNPFFTAVLATACGLALLAPNAVAVLALATLLAAIQLQVRAVEEPHLHRTHGATYRDYTREVGRFVPGIGLGTRDEHA